MRQENLKMELFQSIIKIYGYTKDEDGELIIVPEEAEIVKRISGCT